MASELTIDAPHTAEAARPILSRREKAAVVVRLLLAEGASLPLMDLPEKLQAELTGQMARMRFIDRKTLRDVAEEFATELDDIGLTFPSGIEGALSVLDGAISPDMAQRLRAQSGALWGDDPWESICAFDIPKLVELMSSESPEVGAVILSKLHVAKAAELLGALPGPQARGLMLAVSDTEGIEPDAVARIGVALAATQQAEPPRAFTAASVKRLGAILDISNAVTREDVLTGLAEEDETLADRVRAAIFTFADIPDRISPRDVPGIAKSVDQDDLVTAIAGAAGDEKLDRAAKFMLENLPSRLADTLRDAVTDAGQIDPQAAEGAHIAIVRSVRDMADRGEIKLARIET